MSEMEFRRFVASVGSDPETATDFLLAIAERRGEDAAAAVAALAQAQGFDVTIEDARLAQPDVPDRASDLADEDLDGVAGGILMPPVGGPAVVAPLPVGGGAPAVPFDGPATTGNPASGSHLPTW